MLNSEEPFAFAGIWREKEDEAGIEPHCVITTTDPNEIAGKIHDRMRRYA
jgi:putative SOS response-associated peptidase YedK